MKKLTSRPKINTPFRLKPDQLLQIYDLMVKARLLEERLIRMYKQSDGYFWIGGPGEEAYQVPLGLQLNRGQGVEFDYCHLHYRSGPLMIALGMEPIDSIRQMKNTVKDPFSGGRNFSNHFSRRAWNIVPVSSTIETQYLTAIGTALAQKQADAKGITVVNGGEAGTAEGDFASCLIWAARPQAELPLLILVANNGWGISTSAVSQLGERRISDRGKAFQMPTRFVNGNQVEEAYFALQEALAYVRTEKKPYLLELAVSRLYGHSSATGCHFANGEEDCLELFEQQLLAADLITPQQREEKREQYRSEFLALSQQVKQEPLPDPSTLYDFTYYGQKGRYW